MLDQQGGTFNTTTQDDAALARFYRKRALQNLSDGDAGAQAGEPGFESGQEALLAMMDWSLRVAGRWHSAAIGQRV